MKSPDLGSSKKAWFVVAVFIAAIAVLFFATRADAEGPVVDPALSPTKILTCTKPVTREDGSMLRPDEIASIDFFRSETVDGPWTQIGTGTECRFVEDLTALQPGQWYYMAKTIDTDGRPSQPSNMLPLDVRRIQAPAAITDLAWQ